jgi:hypothetical protein
MTRQKLHVNNWMTFEASESAPDERAPKRKGPPSPVRRAAEPRTHNWVSGMGGLNPIPAHLLMHHTS